MKKLCIGLMLVALGAAGAEFKTVIPGTAAGDVKVTCADAGAWSFDVARVTTNGTEELVFRLAAPQDAVPPRFELAFEFPQRAMNHVWTAFAERYFPKPDWSGWQSSDLAHGLPVCALLDGNDRNRFTLACSEALKRVEWRLVLQEESCLVTGGLRFFTVSEAPCRAYEVRVRLDARDVFWSDAVRAASDWITTTAGLAPCTVPEAAFDPLYSSWYSFHQNVFDKDIEAECARAAKLGMKTLIVDDGWQTDDNNRGYAYCGDWQVAKRRFPDMAAHVARVHALGMKYMIWYGVPMIGLKSANWKRFEGKYLWTQNDRWSGYSCLDPRFPEVRAFLCGIYSAAMKDWNLDGLKLDFIDAISFRGADPAVKQNYAGRDVKSLSEATDKLMKEVHEAIAAVKPEALVEFRQSYIGPAIRQYGNMLRAADCPGDLQGNRLRIANLRLTSGTSAVHADMLEWHPSDTPASAARAILSSIFGVVQYSMMLRGLPPAHEQVIRHWLGFSQAHRETLLKSAFRAHHPEALYPLLEAESAAERIFGVYTEGHAVPCGKADRPVYVLNGTGADGVILDLAAVPEALDVFDAEGRRVTVPVPETAGLLRVAVPAGGYARVAYTVQPPQPAFAWRLPPGGTCDGKTLAVAYDARMRENGTYATCWFDAARYAGRTVRFTVDYAAEAAAGIDNKVKFMFHWIDAEGRKYWREVYTPLKTGRGTATFCADLSGMRLAKSAMLALGLFHAKAGRIAFDLSTLRLSVQPPLYPRANADWRVKYPDAVAKAPLKRGVMLPVVPTEKDFADLHALGATLVRYQMNPHGEKRPADDAPEGVQIGYFDNWLMARLDYFEKNVLAWCRKYGIQAVLDCHGSCGGREPDSNETRMFHNRAYFDHFVQTWGGIAARFKGNEDAIYGYDIHNEPVQTRAALPGCDYWNLQRRCAEEIRKSDAKTPIIVAAVDWDNPEGFRVLSPLAMDNVIYQVHCYNPHDFTHQCVGKNPKLQKLSYPIKRSDGTLVDKEWLRANLKPVLDFQKRHNAKIYVGEFSAITWADGAHRYIRDVIELCEEYGWDWTYHAFREWEGWSVEHAATAHPADDPKARGKIVPSADNPRRTILFKALKGGFAVSPPRACRAVLELPPGPGNPRNSEGDFIQLKDGRILFAYSRFNGSHGDDHGAAEIAVRESRDGGRTWSQKDEILVKNEGAQNVMSVSFLRLQDGRIAFFYLVKNSNDDLYPVVRFSTDEAKTWSAPVRCIDAAHRAYYVMNNARVIQLKSGRLVLPLGRHAAVKGGWVNAADLMTALSDDGGRTWRLGKGCLAMHDAKGRITTQETGVVELKDGRVLMWARTDRGVQWAAYSTDGGETFGAPFAWNLFSPLSPATVTRLSNGRLVAVWNDHADHPEYAKAGPNWSFGVRAPLAIAFSDDEGTTWTERQLLETDMKNGWYCYIACRETDGKLLLGYCALKCLAHSRISLLDL